MKNILLTTLIVSILIGVSSCGDDESPAPPHEVGVWTFDGFVISNVPADFAQQVTTGDYLDVIFEGRLITMNDITSFDTYTLTLNQDGTYSELIQAPGPDNSITGTWVLEGDELILTTEDDDEVIYFVERNENDELWLAQETQDFDIPDAVLDTLTSEYYEGLTAEERAAVNNQIFQPITFDLIYIFER